MKWWSHILIIQTVFPGSLHHKHKPNEQVTGAGFHPEFQESEDFLLKNQELSTL